jgi:hypothetical protein
MSDKANYIWIKFHIDLLDDVPFMTLSDSAIAVYLKLYLWAGKSDAGGSITNRNDAMELEEIAWLLRIPVETFKPIISELVDAGFVTLNGNGYEITRFMEEQGPGDDDKREKWRERQRRRRVRMKIEKQMEEEDSEGDVEGEEEGDVDIDIDCHGDVTVTGVPPEGGFSIPASSTSLFSFYQLYEDDDSKFFNQAAETLGLETWDEAATFDYVFARFFHKQVVNLLPSEYFDSMVNALQEYARYKRSEMDTQYLDCLYYYGSQMEAYNKNRIKNALKEWNPSTEWTLSEWADFAENHMT